MSLSKFCCVSVSVPCDHVLAKWYRWEVSMGSPLQAVARDKSDSFLVISSVSREEGSPIEAGMVCWGSPRERGAVLLCISGCTWPTILPLLAYYPHLAAEPGSKHVNSLMSLTHYLQVPQSGHAIFLVLSG